ncbi:hypothetical protein [Streptomyces sp. NPDC001661]
MTARDVFGAHGIAATLGGDADDAVTSLIVLGGLLALYDGAEVRLKPLFGRLADRIGVRPVLLGRLVAFAAASTLYAISDSPGRLWAPRLGQRAAASAFSSSRPPYRRCPRTGRRCSTWRAERPIPSSWSGAWTMKRDFL